MKRVALFGMLMSLSVLGVWACGETVATIPGEMDDAGQQPAGDAGATGEDSGTVGEDAGQIGDGGETADAGETDAGPGDAGTQADAGNFEGVQCGATTCAVGEVCCVSVTADGGSGTCATSCPDGGGTVACDGPEDCSGSTCCGTATETGTAPLCTITGVTATCDATCSTSNMPPTQCTTSEVVLCHAKADCAGQVGYADCCSFGDGGVTSFCVDTFSRGFATSCAP